MHKEIFGHGALVHQLGLGLRHGRRAGRHRERVAKHLGLVVSQEKHDVWLARLAVRSGFPAALERGDLLLESRDRLLEPRILRLALRELRLDLRELRLELGELRAIISAVAREARRGKISTRPRSRFDNWPTAL